MYLAYSMLVCFNSALLLRMQLYSFILCLLFIPSLDSFLHCTCLDSHSLTSFSAGIFFLFFSMWIHLLSWVQISPIHQSRFRCVVYATKSLQLFFFFQLNVIFKSKKHLNLSISSLINVMQTNSCRTWPDVSCSFENERVFIKVFILKLFFEWGFQFQVIIQLPEILSIGLSFEMSKAQIHMHYSICSPLSLHLVVCHGEK